MYGTHDLIVFLATGLLLNAMPGPDTIYIVSRSSTQGLRAGILATLGVSVGILIHIFATVLGISAILAASATAFTLIKLVGAIYLIYLGLSFVKSSRPSQTRLRSDFEPAPLTVVFLQGFLTNVLNVKVAIFFLAFLPQFVTNEAFNKPVAFLFLGLLFNLTGTVWNLAVAWSTARITRQVLETYTDTTWLRYFAGGLLIFFGIRLALFQSQYVP